jgi:hypothetical protein
MTTEQGKGDGRIKGIGADGTEYYLPKQSIDFRPLDLKARLLALGSLAVGIGELVLMTYLIFGLNGEDKKPPTPMPDSGVLPTVQAIQTQMSKNEIGDCINENAVRDIYGVENKTLKGCSDERDDWAKAFDEVKKKATPMPTVPPTPPKGG